MSLKDIFPTVAYGRACNDGWHQAGARENPQIASLLLRISTPLEMTLRVCQLSARWACPGWFLPAITRLDIEIAFLSFQHDFLRVESIPKHRRAVTTVPTDKKYSSTSSTRYSWCNELICNWQVSKRQKNKNVALTDIQLSMRWHIYMGWETVSFWRQSFENMLVTIYLIFVRIHYYYAVHTYRFSWSDGKSAAFFRSSNPLIRTLFWFL